MIDTPLGAWIGVPGRVRPPRLRWDVLSVEGVLRLVFSHGGGAPVGEGAEP